MSDFSTGVRCPHGIDTGASCALCAREIQTGMTGPLSWEPGSLSRLTLERVLTDAIADLYGDAYRRGESTRERSTRFMADLKRCVQAATGVDFISLRTIERG